MRTTRHTCSRCGGNRHVRKNRTDDGHCGQCRQVLARRGDDLPFAGHWVRRGLIMVPVIDDAAPEAEPPSCIDCRGPVSRAEVVRCRPCNIANQRAHINLCDCGRRISDTADMCGTCLIADRENRWDATALGVAHRQFTRGLRDDWTVEGEREYNRRAKRDQLARKKVA